MTKYLVTGATGFIGSNLARTLVAQNKDVVLFTEKNPNLWRITDILARCTTYECDITDEQEIESLIQKVKPDIIFHLAATGINPNIQQENNKTVFDVNFYGTINLLNACKKIPFTCFVATGTATEYGQHDEPLSEDIQLKPLDDYSISKACTTLYCQKEALVQALPIYVVRPFCVYGPYEPPHRLISTLCANAIQNKEIKLSSPHFVRDFIHVDDVTDFYVILSEKLPAQKIFNVGTGQQHSIQEVVDIVQLISKKKLSVLWGESEPRPWELKNWQADIKQAQKSLSFKPQHTLYDGIKKTFEWFENNLDLYHKI